MWTRRQGMYSTEAHPPERTPSPQRRMRGQAASMLNRQGLSP